MAHADARAVRRLIRSSSLVVLLAGVPACSDYSQQPLLTDQHVPPVPGHRPLVLSDMSGHNGEDATRNDENIGVRGAGRNTHYGPGGKLYYEDGSPVQFDSVRKQLQDLRAEEQIRPR